MDKLLLTFLMILLNSCSNLPSIPVFDVQVAKDCNGKPSCYTSLQAALDGANGKPYLVYLHTGRYNEKVNINQANIHVIGDGIGKSVLYNELVAANAGKFHRDGWGTAGSATLTINAVNITIENVQIQNTFDFRQNDSKQKQDPSRINASQAVAVLLDVQSDKVAFVNSRLDGNQDTLFAHGKRAYFHGGAISGSVDFIFGDGQMVFEGVEIINLARGGKGKTGDIQAYITAPSTSINNAYGLVFIDCQLTREAGVPDGSVSLGRPWHPTTNFADGRYADPQAVGYAAFINTYMDAHIVATGWESMKGTARDGSKTAIFGPQDSRFYERDSSGPGARPLDISVQRRSLPSNMTVSEIKAAVLADWAPTAGADKRSDGLAMQSYTRRSSKAAVPKAGNLYTAENTFKKLVGRFPFITVASSEVPVSVLEHKNIIYSVREGGRELSLDLYTPAQQNNKTRTGIVLVHGGGWHSGFRENMTPLAIALADKGYVVATVSYHLAAEAPYPAAIYDVKSAIRWLRENAALYGVNPQAIVVGGGSAGGQIASLIGVTNGDLRFDPQMQQSSVGSDVQAIINIDGLSDFTTKEALKYEDDEKKHPSAAGLWFGGRYHERTAIWTEASPITHVSVQTPPILFLLSGQGRFSAGKDEMQRQLVNYQIYYEEQKIPDTPHSFWLFEPWLTHTADIIDGFLTRYKSQ